MIVLFLVTTRFIFKSTQFGIKSENWAYLNHVNDYLLIMDPEVTSGHISIEENAILYCNNSSTFYDAFKLKQAADIHRYSDYKNLFVEEKHIICTIHHLFIVRNGS
jgi:uncharacterized CHY-type Zn-finger protein